MGRRFEFAALALSAALGACGDDEPSPTGAGGAGGAGAASASGGGNAGGASNAGGAGGSANSNKECKRGLASNIAPGAAFAPKIAWWYNWSLQGSGQGAGIEFVPMVWGEGSVGQPIPATSGFVLGFNEPNFHAQSNLTAAAAATLWPTLEADAVGLEIVGPAMNFCGPEGECNGTSPYQYLKDFFQACAGCRVDYLAIHWYNCDLPSLVDYIEPGGNLEGFEQFGKPIWVTEMSCNPSASVAEQQAYMEAAIPYLESKPEIFRYSWFSAGPIPNAELLQADGSPNALGQVYIDLPRACDEG
ncbi:MAG: glycoside hydrolase family protein [Polyangiaceae bacterium]